MPFLVLPGMMEMALHRSSIASAFTDTPCMALSTLCQTPSRNPFTELLGLKGCSMVWFKLLLDPCRWHHPWPEPCTALPPRASPRL